jgi:enoyl-[acyl-carrier protein] reductase I
LAESVDSDFVLDADVTSEGSLDSLFAALAERWGRLDFLVHAIAFSDKNELTGKYVETSRTNFLRTLEISCFSFTDVCRRAVPLMRAGGSLLTLTYAGAERVMPHYNVMGVAKAALEASVRYLAADLGGDNIRSTRSRRPEKTLCRLRDRRFRYILKWNQLNSPLQRSVTIQDVGGAGGLSAGDLAPGSGEVHHVDSAIRRRHEARRRARHRGRVTEAWPAKRSHLFRYTSWGEPRAGDRRRGRWRAAADSARRARYPALARPAPAGPVALHDAAARAGRGQDPVRRI